MKRPCRRHEIITGFTLSINSSLQPWIYHLPHEDPEQFIGNDEWTLQTHKQYYLLKQSTIRWGKRPQQTKVNFQQSHSRVSCRAQGTTRVKTRSLETQTYPTAKKTSCLGKISKLFHSIQFPNAVFLALALFKQNGQLKSIYYSPCPNGQCKNLFVLAAHQKKWL